MEQQSAYKTTFNSTEELGRFIGKELGLTPWLTIDQKRITAFANVTEDHQWIHLDEEKCAKESPYKSTIAHGFLTVSLCAKFMFEAYEVKDSPMILNYGMDKVRFPSAIPVDSKCRGRVSLQEFDVTPQGAKYKLNVVVEVEGAEKPACVAEFLVLMFADS
ncbi:MaoC family dehydratase [Flavobacteriaceae bacterium]|jgi:acyl dehydratase|nr:MaoC family dehydratase [Flavobacteriaceae bacterium]